MPVAASVQQNTQPTATSIEMRRAYDALGIKPEQGATGLLTNATNQPRPSIRLPISGGPSIPMSSIGSVRVLAPNQMQVPPNVTLPLGNDSPGTSAQNAVAQAASALQQNVNAQLFGINTVDARTQGLVSKSFNV